MISRRELFYRFLLLSGSVLLLFIGGEIVLRTAYSIDRARGGSLKERLERSRSTDLENGEKQYNIGGLVQASRFEDVVYELKAGLRGMFRNKLVETNSVGLRDREYSLRKPPNTIRIVGMGDSVMFGWGVDERDTFLNVIEERLNGLPQPHPDYEVLNFAVPGYNTAIEVAVFEHNALPYQPDLAIIHFVNNDWGVPKFMQKPREPLSLKRSYFLELIMTRLGWLKAEREGRLVGYRLEGLEEEEQQEISEKYRYMLYRRGYRRAMNHLGDLARERGIPVIVLIGSTRRGQKREILARAEENGFHIVDIGPYTDMVLEEEGIENTPEVLRRVLQVAKGDPHPNAFGHDIYARGLFEKIEELGLADLARSP